MSTASALWFAIRCCTERANRPASEANKTTDPTGLTIASSARRKSRASCRLTSHRVHRVTIPDPYSRSLLSRNAFAITETELRVIAALAQMGLMSVPVSG